MWYFCINPQLLVPLEAGQARIRIQGTGGLERQSMIKATSNQSQAGLPFRGSLKHDARREVVVSAVQTLLHVAVQECIGRRAFWLQVSALNE